MAKIQITKIIVLNLEYKGERTASLVKNHRYIGVAIEGFTDEGSALVLKLQCGSQRTIIYDSFVSFSKDWEIISEFVFDDCFTPVKSKD